jgi:hypothetical protein
MKIISKIGILILGVLAVTSFITGCAGSDDEFVHKTNTISQMVCEAVHGGTQFRGEIHEYNKDGVLMTGDFTQEEVEGGYGLIIFAVSQTLQSDVDLANIYLIATVTYDEFITPSLSGKHDITGEGIIITVKSGVGTTRQYRIRGYYE